MASAKIDPLSGQPCLMPDPIKMEPNSEPLNTSIAIQKAKSCRMARMNPQGMCMADRTMKIQSWASEGKAVRKSNKNCGRPLEVSGGHRHRRSLKTEEVVLDVPAATKPRC